MLVYTELRAVALENEGAASAGAIVSQAGLESS
jgi:hypothetical protein